MVTTIGSSEILIRKRQGEIISNIRDFDSNCRIKVINESQTEWIQLILGM